ncbi:YkgJ family cysteine cluster protein [Aggregatilineales bacterium SYSU G02658]
MYSIDLAAIAADAPARRDAYEVMFYQFQYDDDLTDEQLDALVNAVAAPIIAAIDCTQCANCCRSLDVYLEADDLPRLSQACHIHLDEVRVRFVDEDVLPESGAVGKLNVKPCGFLDGQRCRIYAHRPQACRDYPFLTPDFRWSMEQLVAGAAICPIIYHTLNALLEKVDAITARSSSAPDEPQP